jgi:hypothetical protein
MKKKAPHVSRASAVLEMTLKSKAAHVKTIGRLIHSAPTGRQPIAGKDLRIGAPDQWPGLTLLIAANCSEVAVP